MIDTLQAVMNKKRERSSRWQAMQVIISFSIVNVLDRAALSSFLDKTKSVADGADVSEHRNAGSGR